MDAKATLAHLRQVHKIHNLNELKGKKSLVLALDGDFYSNTFEWKFGDGVTVTEISSGPK